MPTISPFRALCYAPRLRSDLDRLVAPPYDVLSEERRDRLAARHPNNVVHVDLPRPPAGGDPYAWAARLVGDWIHDGVLTRDDRPAFYACEQRYRSPAGDERTRRGFFARLRLEPLDGGVVIPHERTLDGPRADRQRLLAATGTHLSPVFLLHPDPGGAVSALMREAAGQAAWMEARDDEGTTSRVVRIDDPERIAFLVERLAGQWALIADGHHRYESALACREERRAAGHDDAGAILVFLCSLEDPGLAIVPIHRLVRSLPDGEAGRLRGRLRDYFRLEPVSDEAALGRELAARRGRPGVFGIGVRAGAEFFLAEWIEGAGLDRPEMRAIPEPLRRLDVILLHRLVLEGILGITAEDQARQTRLDYAKDNREWAERLRQGAAEVGFLMNPTRMEQVIEVTRKGLRLPQKSTYFHPKVLTGLVFDPLRG
jgi:uncharacterized protein (DUF1015 family)